MPRLSAQAPDSVVMIRPHHFTPNPQTAADNSYQRSCNRRNETEIARDAYGEVTRASQLLEKAGVEVLLFEDDSRETPDSVFPNNWFSTHSGGHVAVYPMYSQNRRKERRWDIIESLKHSHRVQDVIDFSGLELDGVFLEGTGAMVLDHIERVAYAIRSNRANAIALERFCTHFNFEPMVFDAADDQGAPIYHTNVVMCIGSEFVLAGMELLTDLVRREEIRARLSATGRDFIELTAAQIAEFAGNALELQGKDNRLLALSSRALKALTPLQRKTLEKHLDLLPLEIPTIELAGGSVRCMMAGIHLAKRD
ncbi:citrulline utilization hydrolase CtlX [Rhodovibrionaceae bacterium A322]